MDEKSKMTPGKVTGQIIVRMENLRESQRRAELACLRSAIGKTLAEADDVWPIFFKYLPQEYLSENGVETAAEKAILTVLEFYAVCMQGASHGVTSDTGFRGSIGKSLASIRDPEDSSAIDRRFNAMITASTFKELTYHLRQLIKIARSRDGVTVNFARLADDLFFYQLGDGKKTRMQWAKDYYSRPYKDEAADTDL